MRGKRILIKIPINPSVPFTRGYYITDKKIRSNLFLNQQNERMQFLKILHHDVISYGMLVMLIRIKFIN